VSDCGELVHAFGRREPFSPEARGRQGLELLDIVTPISRCVAGGLQRASGADGKWCFQRGADRRRGRGGVPYNVKIPLGAQSERGALPLLVTFEAIQGSRRPARSPNTRSTCNGLSRSARAPRMESRYQGELAGGIEELETGNEEAADHQRRLQTSNEELQSTNEELQSVNERALYGQRRVPEQESPSSPSLRTTWITSCRARNRTIFLDASSHRSSRRASPRTSTLVAHDVAGPSTPSPYIDHPN